MNACTNMWNCVQEGILEDLLPHFDESTVQNILNWLQTQYTVVALSCLLTQACIYRGITPFQRPFLQHGKGWGSCNLTWCLTFPSSDLILEDDKKKGMMRHDA